MISEVYNGDCMDYMARFPDKFFELAVVDPPYQNNDAIGVKNGKKHAGKRVDYHLFENKKPSDLYFAELKRVSKNQIIWGGNYFGLIGGGIVWNKNGTVFGEAEIAICSTHHSVKIYEFTWNGMLQQNMKEKEIRIHPTQKPVALYRWILQNYAKDGDKILDTHLGSGSSRIAAHQMGFDFYGCELDKEYFDASVKRFENEIKQQSLFEFKQQILI